MASTKHLLLLGLTVLIVKQVRFVIHISIYTFEIYMFIIFSLRVINIPSFMSSNTLYLLLNYESQDILTIGIYSSFT